MDPLAISKSGLLKEDFKKLRPVLDNSHKIIFG